jgi:hypothetical protein
MKTIGVSLIVTALSMGELSAQSAYIHCNKVLEGETFDRYFQSSQANSAFRTEMQNHAFSLSDTEAWDSFQQEKSRRKQQGQSGSGAFNAWPYGGSLDFSISYDNDISEAEFKSKFRAAKQIRESRSSSQTQSDTALITSSASYIRNPATIDAWTKCVQATPKAGIIAFGSRGADDEPVINVIWNPGDLAGVAPSIPVTINLTEGAVLQTPIAEIAMGSGVRGRIVSSNPDKGITVTVNATLRNSAGHLTNSWESVVNIPSLRENASFLGTWVARGRGREGDGVYEFYQDDGKSLVGIAYKIHPSPAPESAVRRRREGGGGRPSGTPSQASTGGSILGTRDANDLKAAKLEFVTQQDFLNAALKRLGRSDLPDTGITNCTAKAFMFARLTDNNTLRVWSNEMEVCGIRMPTHAVKDFHRK